MQKVTKLLLFCVLVFLVFPSKAQNQNNASLDKIYTQTDRPLYFPGETIWFKSYIVNEHNLVSTHGEIMYASLISPKGSTVKKLKLKIIDGYAYGDFRLNESWVGGIYKIKMSTNYLGNFGEASYFTKNITVQKIVKPNVLFNLEFEKQGYGKSSLVKASFKAKDLKNQPIGNRSVSINVSFKGELLIIKKIDTDSNGKADIEFQLPDDLNTTDVVLNVLLEHKGSFESISKAVPVVLDNIDLQFLPESGKLLGGFKNRLAFKAINEFGKPVDVEGEIYDENDKIIITFKSFHDGMGAFSFIPEKAKTYYAKLSSPVLSERKINLPKIHSSGIHFNVTTDSLTTSIKLFSTLNKDLKIELSNAYNLLYSSTIKKGEEDFSINTSEFPAGITKIKILDDYDMTIAERLIFLNPHKQLIVNIELEKEVYQTRERVKVKITTKDEKNKPIPSNLSLAIADNKLLSFADDKQDHILSYLFLSSELKGKIHEPSFYFNPEKEKSKKALDYVMLTHGWRDYIIKPKKWSEILFKPEQSNTINGRTINQYGVGASANLLLFDSYGNKVLSFKSNDKGYFSFKQEDNKQVTLIAYLESGKRVFVRDVDYSKKIDSDLSFNKNVKKNAENYLPPRAIKAKQQTRIKEGNMSVSLGANLESLEEVVVLAYGIEMERNLSSSVVQLRNDDINSNESLASILQGRVPGVQVTNSSGIDGNSSSVSIRGSSSISGNNQPLLIVDGIPYGFDAYSRLSAVEIESVTIIKNQASVALYGSSGSNGVIVVTTKHSNFHSSWGMKKLNNAKFNNYSIKNYYQINNSDFYSSRLFYIPKYVGEDIPKKRTDFRQTIYWNPVIQTDMKGEAEFEFYNSDAITSFQVLAEGIGYNGLIGRQKQNYSTKKLLNLDFKTPNYMVLNDTISLPVTISNESDQDIYGSFNIQLPPEIKLLEAFKNSVELKANQSIVRYVKITPIEKSKKLSIGMSIFSSQMRDYVEREFSILSPYFPTEVSISGSTSNVYNYNIKNLVEGSIKAEFNIYTDVIGEVMDGVEGMLAHPSGCFEQVSSTTYPNILILQYLRQVNKSNPEIETKALNYIKTGYKKLAGYETSKDGFEWYGKTPPHEVLSAYGLMEFTEMKKVYDGVSQPMLDRTIAYLMSRKNGKGGFKQNSGKYAFSYAPKKVNNAYIVYAISESGINADIEKEYNSSFNEALKSNDTYRVALMANASYNLGKNANAKLLIDKLKQNIEKFGFPNLPVENTITQSYHDTKQIETVAFSILALLKEDIKDEYLISNGIDYMLGKRKYGRFGSTQSTSMALKALIEFTKSQQSKMISEEDSFSLSFNGKKIKQKLSTENNGKIVLDSLNTYIVEGLQNFEVVFSNEENSFPYSLNISYDSFLPDSSSESPLDFTTTIEDKVFKVGENISMTIDVKNNSNQNLGMLTTIVGIPSGTTAQPWQLKKLLEEEQFAYYEVFDNYLVFYWRSIKALEYKTIRLDLKADIKGSFKAPASTCYLYYGDEFKTWIGGEKVTIE